MMMGNFNGLGGLMQMLQQGGLNIPGRQQQAPQRGGLPGMGGMLGGMGGMQMLQQLMGGQMGQRQQQAPGRGKKMISPDAAQRVQAGLNRRRGQQASPLAGLMPLLGMFGR